LGLEILDEDNGAEGRGKGYRDNSPFFPPIIISSFREFSEGRILEGREKVNPHIFIPSCTFVNSVSFIKS